MDSSSVIDTGYQSVSIGQVWCVVVIVRDESRDWVFSGGEPDQLPLGLSVLGSRRICLFRFALTIITFLCLLLVHDYDS